MSFESDARQRVAITIASTDAVFDAVDREVRNQIRTRYQPNMSEAELDGMLRDIDAVLDRAFGATRPDAVRSELYRVIRAELGVTATVPVRAAIDRVAVIIDARDPALWRHVDRTLIDLAPTGTDRFAELYAALKQGREVEAAVRLQRMRQLDPQRRWVPRSKWNTKTGYRLSDRVWKGGRRVRREIDRTIRDAIARGLSPYTLADELERYLRPSRQPIRYLADGRIIRRNMTRRPSGWASSWARTLARTETMRVHGMAALEAAETVPGYRGVRWRTSTRHRHADVCTGNANRRTALGIGVYDRRSLPRYPAHPNELCVLSPVVADPEVVIEEIVRRYGRPQAA